MQVISYSKSRDNLAKIIEDVNNNNETIIITKNDKKAVLISLDEYNSWKETSYLLQSKSNAKKLMQSLKEVDNNNIKKKKLIEEDEKTN